MDNALIPLRRVFRAQGLLALLESQYSSISSRDMAVELVWEDGFDGTALEKYRLYVPDKSGEMERDRFLLKRTIRHGKVREVVLEGSIYFEQ